MLAQRFPRPLMSHNGNEYAWDDEQQAVILFGNSTGFEGNPIEIEGRAAFSAPRNAHNAAALRQRLPWLMPRPLGLHTSAGFGDRLGLGTPGHIRALRAVGAGDGAIAPIFAQQSIREMTRTERSAQQVLDDALWGVFSQNWQQPWGSDADHLKQPEDIDRCAAAGYTFYTIDPGEHVGTVTGDAVNGAVTGLPWDALEDSLNDLRTRYMGQRFDYGSGTLTLDETALYQSAAKYGKVIAQVVRMYRHLLGAMNGKPFDFEVSVDETESPTTHAEHLYLATELRRLGVQWVSLAPRFIGRFEKGVEYIGDLSAFEQDFAVHAAIARAFGPYKLSLHSGSDKFDVYPIAVKHTGGLVHLKTAGTSYLEALRVLTTTDPSLFRKIYAFALERYDVDRATYHVSASTERAPKPGHLKDSDLPPLCDDFDVRQILHVTFGSVMIARGTDGALLFRERLLSAIRQHSSAYADTLEAHFKRHLQPFMAKK